MRVLCKGRGRVAVLSELELRDLSRALGAPGSGILVIHSCSKRGVPTLNYSHFVYRGWSLVPHIVPRRVLAAVPPCSLQKKSVRSKSAVRRNLIAWLAKRRCGLTLQTSRQDIFKRTQQQSPGDRGLPRETQGCESRPRACASHDDIPAVIGAPLRSAYAKEMCSCRAGCVESPRPLLPRDTVGLYIAVSIALLLL